MSRNIERISILQPSIGVGDSFQCQVSLENGEIFFCAMAIQQLTSFPQQFRGRIILKNSAKISFSALCVKHPMVAKPLKDLITEQIIVLES